MIIVDGPIELVNIYNMIEEKTIQLDINQLIVNILNTNILDKISFINSGESDVSLYRDVIDMIKDHIGLALTDNEEIVFYCNLMDSIGISCAQFLTILNKRQLINKDIIVMNTTIDKVMIEVGL
jgi:hypothetical protein